MSRFHVGQRVRYIGKPGHGIMLGCLGVVTGFRPDRTQPELNVLVLFDGHYANAVERGAYHVKPSAIEPIDDRDDSREVTEWSKCVFQPKGLRVKA